MSLPGTSFHVFTSSRRLHTFGLGLRFRTFALRFSTSRRLCTFSSVSLSHFPLRPQFAFISFLGLRRFISALVVLVSFRAFGFRASRPVPSRIGLVSRSWKVEMNATVTVAPN